MIEFTMPSLGADMEAGTLSEWRVKSGDKVKRGDIIADVETQKGLIEVEVFEDGIIDKLLINEGEKVPVGTVLALISTKNGQVEKSGEMEKIEKKTFMNQSISDLAEKSKIEPEISSNEKPENKRIKITPLAREIAQKNNIDYTKINGSNPDGAISKKDIEKVLFERDNLKQEDVKPEKIKIEDQMTNVQQKPVVSNEAIRSAIAAAMTKSNNEIPHYYLEKKIDMSKALAWLRETNEQLPIKNRLLPVTLLIKAVAKGLNEVPELNAIWDNGIQIMNEINIGLVISLRAGGLVIPTIHQVDDKSVSDIMEILNELIPRARGLRLRSSELSGSTFTITNLGDRGADKVFGIIYPPQVAIIGFGSISDQPFVENGMLGIRPVLSVTLGGDHRATDGLTGSRFLSALNNYLQNPAEL